MYQSFLPDKISKTYCNSSKLKAKLEKHYKDAIVFFAQQGQGKSSIVFASDISIGDAVKAANSIKAELELLEIKADLSTCSSTKTNEQTDMHVLYAAASILRQKMENVYISGDYYPANDEASLEMSEAMLPTSLISFITWLLDKKSFETFSSVSMDISHDIRRKCAALAELGGFHALSCFIAAVGKLWSEAGLKDLLVDSGVYAGTTAEQMLSGKQFNRAVRGLTLVYEALMHVLLSQFFQYCDLEDRLADVPKHLWSRMKEANLQFESSACSGNSQPVDNLAETFTQYVTPVLTEYIGSARDTLHIHVDPELVFRRALTLSSSRDDVSLQKIMEHPIGPVPTSIFHDDGSMRKSVKAELLHKLEETASSVPVLPDFDKSKTVFIRDGMAIVQTFHVKKSSTFGDLANDYVARALSNYHQSETVIDVFDRYDVLLSVKSSERERRSSKTGYSGLYQVIESRLVPDWKRFFVCLSKQKILFTFPW
ncbi:Hypothetical predicted protein [Mytilus galloprovincialis]|uniref:Uncharacterized protein n=2 Tax=Mytilus galloprovincialis TaxID=29158 RepID=A0A8B6FHB8_MYTGA|nr:Hypothetical predicted protein [Mytilus galloprovincialis]